MEVLALYSLQKAIKLIPWGANAGPIGGAGFAFPASICNRRTVFNFFATKFLLQSFSLLQKGFAFLPSSTAPALEPSAFNHMQKGFAFLPSSRAPALEPSAFNHMQKGFAFLPSSRAPALEPLAFNHMQKGFAFLPSSRAPALEPYPLSTCKKSSSTGVSRPKNETITRTLALSISMLSTVPMKSLKGPSMIRTFWPTV
jgi:hypothetical protein